LSQDGDGDYRKDDEWRLDHGDPKTVLQEYEYQNPWVKLGDISDHSYRSLPEPEHRADWNEGFGGSLLLDDERYVVPFRASFGTVAEILQDKADDLEDVFIDYQPQYLELAPSDATEKYQLAPGLRGKNKVTGSEIIDEVLIFDKGSEEVFEQFQVDKLAKNYFIDQLAEIDMIDSELAEELIKEYGNLRTVSWAATSDVEYMEDTWGLDCHQLFKELGEAGVYRNKDSLDAGRLHFPERRADELSESRQETVFGEVLEPQDEDSEVEQEDTGEQAGLTDF
jgi:hypothetical protein